MATTRELIFVYNADSGLFNALADAAHKALSPQTYACNLCRVTYGLLREKRAWRDFVATLGCRTSFLHRDELARRFPGLEIALPAVVSVADAGVPSVCVDAATLNHCRTIDQLSERVRSACCPAEDSC
jgi:hypothetical protein